MAIFVGVKIYAASVTLPEEKWVDITYSLVVQVGIVLILPFILYCISLKVTPKQLLKTCNFNKVSPLVILISIGLAFVCFFINLLVSSLSNGLIGFSGYRQVGVPIEYAYTVPNLFLDLLTVAVLPAFCEEFLHRGILLQGTKHMGFKKAILLSSLLFGLLHFSIQKFFYAFVIGLILGLVSVVAKSIWPSIIIHFINNGISVYLDYASANGWFGGKFMNFLNVWLSSTEFVAIFLTSIVFVVLVIGMLILFIWLLYKQAMLAKVRRALDRVYNASDFAKTSHVVINKDSVFHDLLEKNTLLNLTYRPKDNPIDLVLPKEKSQYKTTFKDNIFMIGSVVLGVAITLFTYIWGLL